MWLTSKNNWFFQPLNAFRISQHYKVTIRPFFSIFPREGELIQALKSGDIDSNDLFISFDHLFPSQLHFLPFSLALFWQTLRDWLDWTQHALLALLQWHFSLWVRKTQRLWHLSKLLLKETSNLLLLQQHQANVKLWDECSQWGALWDLMLRIWHCFCKRKPLLLLFLQQFKFTLCFIFIFLFFTFQLGTLPSSVTIVRSDIQLPALAFVRVENYIHTLMTRGSTDYDIGNTQLRALYKMRLLPIHFIHS